MPLQLSIAPRAHVLSDDLTVRRVLPAAASRHVGPFVFFDHFGPVRLPADADTDIGPHPHIGLATVTYLFEGRMLHRDSLGSVQEIAPGAVNWMTAGHGIVHSERRAEADQGRPRALHGLQLWVALPPGAQAGAEDGPPAFQHVPATDLPELHDGDARVRVLAGEAFGARSPVRTVAPTLYLDVTLGASGRWTLPPLAAERAVYAPTQDVQVDGGPLPAATLGVLQPGHPATITGEPGSRFVVVGGTPPAAPPMIWWNFVASDADRIETAARKWDADGFPHVPGETDRLRMPPFKRAT